MRHPERVTHLVIYGGFALGGKLRDRTMEEVEEREALVTLMRLGWGRENPSYRQVFTNNFMPAGSVEHMDWFNELQRVSASPENAVRTTDVTANIDVRA